MFYRKEGDAAGPTPNTLPHSTSFHPPPLPTHSFAEKARGNEKWTRRLRNKALHRRLRNKAYALAWEEQRRQRTEQQQQERASDADRMKITHQQEDLQRRRAERDAAERLALARRIQVENLAATTRRRSTGPAAAGGPAPAVGDTYWGRCEAPPSKPSGAGIRAGIEAIQSRRKEQAARAREEEQAAYEAQRRQWDDEDERRRERSRAEKAVLLEEYRSHMAGKAAAASAGRSGLGTDSATAPSPSPPAAAAAAAAAAESNFIFHGRTAAEMVEDEQKERRDRRAAAVAVQRENKRAVESAQKAKRVHNGMRKYADKRHLDKTVQRELYTDGDVLQSLHKRQQELRAAWDGQIKERKEFRDRERRNTYSASTLHAWRNESSDEEYDDFQQNRIVHHPLVH